MYEALYEQNRGLLWALANRWRTACERDRAVSVEDLTQAGFFGLVKAAETFDPSAGKAWSSWAAWFIFKEFENALCIREGQALQPHTGALALDAPMPSEDAGGATYGDMLADDSMPEVDAGAVLDDLQRRVHEAVDDLQDDAQRRTVQLYDLEGKTIQEAAEALSVPVTRAYTIRRKALITLHQDQRLSALRDEANLDELTRFHSHKGLRAFERDWTSVTEGAALWRIEQRARGQDDPAAAMPDR